MHNLVMIQCMQLGLMYYVQLRKWNTEPSMKKICSWCELKKMDNSKVKAKYFMRVSTPNANDNKIKLFFRTKT